MKTKPRGIWANFSTSCPHCREEFTVSQGKIDPHDCRPERPVTLEQIRAALEARTITKEN